MLKKQISLFLFLILFSLIAYSNTKPFPGYYITLKGDSVICNIDFNDWNINPKSIKVQVNNEMHEFTASDIRGFGVNGYDDYLAATINFHTNPVSGKDLPDKFSDSTVTTTCFLKILDQGEYSLFALVLSQRVYMFTGAHNSNISELVYRVSNNNDSLEVDQSYKKEILNLFVKEGISDKYFNRINNASYNASEISSLFRILNENHTGISQKKKSRGEFQAQVFIGGIRNSFPTVFTGDYSNTYQFEPSYTLGGGLNFLYSIPGFFKSFKVGLSFGYNGYNGKLITSGTINHVESAAYYWTTTYNDTVTVRNSLLVSNIYIMYFLNPLSHVKVYLKVGVNYNFSFSNNIDVLTQNTSSTTGIKNGNVPFQSNSAGNHSLVTIKKGYLSFLTSVGVTEGRHTLEFSYSPNAEIADPGNYLFAPFKKSFKIGSMAVYYYFSLFPVTKGK
jgi:hypothetical protein